MHRFGMAQLRERALSALEEVAERCHEAPAERTLALRFTLAFLANFAEEREMFDWFWQSVTSSGGELGRSQNARAALNGIRRAVGAATKS